MHGQFKVVQCLTSRHSTGVCMTQRATLVIFVWPPVHFVHVQATPGVPLPDVDGARQDNGALRARVYGNVFDGAEVVFTWPAAMGPITSPRHVNSSQDGQYYDMKPTNHPTPSRRLQQYSAGNSTAANSSAEAAWTLVYNGLNATVSSYNESLFKVRGHL